MTCPKCHGPMRTYERNGVHVDQCTECRGIFLDRGELERLVDAEQAWHSPTPASPSSSGGAPPGAGGQASLGALVGEVLQQAKGSPGSRGPHPGRKRSKASLIGELFG